MQRGLSSLFPMRSVMMAMVVVVMLLPNGILGGLSRLYRMVLGRRT